MRIWPTKRVLVRWAIGLAILFALALIVNGFFAWRAEWRLRSRLAQIRAAGDPASIAELAPEPIPDAENAAAILAQIEPRLKEFSKEHGRFFNTPIGKAYDAAGDRGEPATPEQIEAIRAILSKYPDVEQAINNAASSDKFASRLDFSLDHTAFIQQLIDHVQDGRTASRFLGWRNEILLADGQHEAAVKNSIQALRLARLHENEPTLVSYLVAIAMRANASDQIYDALAVGNVSPELHAQLDEELARQEDPQRMVRVMKTERALGADWINAQFGSLGGAQTILANMLGWIMKSYQVGVLDGMDEIIQRAPQSMYEVSDWLGPPDGPPPKTEHGVLADLLMPALRAAFEANARSLTVSRALRIDNALRQFAEKNGREAKGLEELDLPKEAVVDPHSGNPLKLKRVEGGWVIYSVMQNGVDDGGDFKKLKDFGVGPRSLRATQ